MHDMPGNRIGPADQVLGAAQIAAVQCLAHRRTRYPAELVADGCHAGQLEPLGAGEAAEHGEIAAPLRAEAEVVADQQVAQLQSADQDVFDERFGRAGGQRRAEVRDIDPLDAVLSQRLELVAQGRDARRCLAFAACCKEFPGVGFESQHARRQAEPCGLAAQARKNGLMAAMDAVEIADRQRTRAALAGGRKTAKDLHRTGHRIERAKL